MARWIVREYDVPAKSFLDLNLQTSKDIEVLKLASKNPSIVIVTTKDFDFVDLLKHLGTPPKVLFFNVGNARKKILRQIFDRSFPAALKLFNETDNPLVEINQKL